MEVGVTVELYGGELYHACAAESQGKHLLKAYYMSRIDSGISCTKTTDLSTYLVEIRFFFLKQWFCGWIGA